jgi:hypothetical protein
VTAVGPGERRKTVGARTLLARATVAAAVAAAVNAALVALAAATGIAGEFRALSYPPVLVLTVVGVAGATAVYAVLLRRRADPDRAFVRTATAVLLLSFLPDVAVLVLDPAATPAGVLVLLVMHVVVAGASVGVLVRGVGRMV